MTVATYLSSTCTSAGGWENLSAAEDSTSSTAATVSANASTGPGYVASFVYNLSDIYSQSIITSAIIKLTAKSSDASYSQALKGTINSTNVFNQTLTKTSTTYSLNITNYIGSSFTLNIVPSSTKTGIGSTFYLYEISLEVTYTLAGTNKIYVSSTKINNLYVGSTEVKKAYVGSILVYEKV